VSFADLDESLFADNDITATDNGDGTWTLTGVATIPAGETSAEIRIPTYDDVIFEGDETLTLTLTGVSNSVADAELEGTPDYTGTIMDNETTQPVVSIEEDVNGRGAVVMEGNELIFALEQDLESSADTTVDWSITVPTKAAAVPGQASIADLDETRFDACGITATDNGDGTWTLTGTATIQAGETSAEIRIPTVDDTILELEETLTLNLSNAVNATIDDGTSVGVILDNDGSGPNVPTLNISDPTVTEGGLLDFVVTQSVVSGADTTASWSITLPDVGTPGVVGYNDLNSGLFGVNGITGTYNSSSGTWTLSGSVSIPAGSTVGHITIPTNDDSVFELSETLNIGLTDAVNATIADGAGVGTITDNDAAAKPTLSINDASVVEGNDLVFTVTQSAASGANTTALWSVVLPAVAGTLGQVSYDDLDVTKFVTNGITATYNSSSGTWTLSGSVSIPAGSTQGTIIIPTNGDTQYEPNETLNVTLSDAVNASIAVGTGLGTILDDDLPPPPVANNDVNAIAQDDSSLHGNLFVNDQDSSSAPAGSFGDAAIETIVAIQPIGGSSVAVSGDTVVQGEYGTLTVHADGSYDYTLTDSAYLQGTDLTPRHDVFTYTIANPGGTDTATLDITVQNSVGSFGANTDDPVTGGSGNDAVIGDIGGYVAGVSTQTHYNVMVSCDFSGSMRGNGLNGFKSAMNVLLDGLSAYTEGSVVLYVNCFNHYIVQQVAVTLVNDGVLNTTLLAQMKNWVSGLTIPGTNVDENYEGGFDAAGAWLAGITKAGGGGGLNAAQIQGLVYNMDTWTGSGLLTEHAAPLSTSSSVYSEGDAIVNKMYFITDGKPMVYTADNGYIGPITSPGTQINIDQVKANTSTDWSGWQYLQDNADMTVVGTAGATAAVLQQLSEDGNYILSSNLTATFNDITNDIEGHEIAVGSDTISGGEGSDLIYGDTINADSLLSVAVPGHPNWASGLEAGSGLAIVAAYLEAVNGHAATNDELREYVMAHAFALAPAGDTRGANDVLSGEGGNDILFGQGGNDTLSGGAGNDLLVGGTGADVLTGGTGADIFLFHPGEGADTITDFNSGDGDILVRAGSGTFGGVSVSGDYVASRDLHTVADVQQGHYLSPADSNNHLLVGAGIAGEKIDANGSTTGGIYDNVLKGGAGNDVIYGGMGDNLLMGGAGSDYIQGGSGNDVIYGGGGADALIGGGGSDIFAWSATDLVLGGTDTIRDFSLGQDRLRFDNLFDDPDNITVDDVLAKLGTNELDIQANAGKLDVTVGGGTVIEISSNSGSFEASVLTAANGDDNDKAQLLLQLLTLHG
jgi:VCBS repeat-containing protein